MKARLPKLLLAAFLLLAAVGQASAQDDLTCNKIGFCWRIFEPAGLTRELQVYSPEWFPPPNEGGLIIVRVHRATSDGQEALPIDLLASWTGVERNGPWYLSFSEWEASYPGGQIIGVWFEIHPFVLPPVPLGGGGELP